VAYWPNAAFALSAAFGSKRACMVESWPTCTIETLKGSGLRLVISQPEAALYIQLPILATTVAVHNTVKAVLRKGLHDEAARSVAPDSRGLLMLS
jgi:hypothetical protein